jgi:Calcineurin-like phosphoesterase
METLTFIQFTDIHLGESAAFPPESLRQIKNNLDTALKEINNLKDNVDFLVVTGDAINRGVEAADEYLSYMNKFDMPVYNIPSSHDLALGDKPDGNIILNDDPTTWEEYMGPAKHSFSHKGVHFIFFEPFRKVDEFSSKNTFDEEYSAWLSTELEKVSPGQALVIGYHIPIIPIKKSYTGWDNAEQFLDLLQGYNVTCISGHRHRNDENMINGIRQIQTGSFAGFQWNGMGPHYIFPVRAGYRIFQVKDSKLCSFYKEIGVEDQVVLETINGIHTMGPRPKIRPVILHSDTVLNIKTYSTDSEFTELEYTLGNKKWTSLSKTNSALWEEWEGIVPYDKFHKKFNIITIRGTLANSKMAYDSVPVHIRERNDSLPAEGGPEMTFELMTSASEADFNKCKDQHDFPWAVIPR